MNYELLDFGEGRKLERFSSTIVDRPAPHATEPKTRPELWRDADLCYRRTGTREDRDAWVGDTPSGWTLAHGDSQFHLKTAATGQVGLFPEQMPNWKWLQGQMDRLTGEKLTDGKLVVDLAKDPCRMGSLARSTTENQSSGKPKILNLFAYTGGSTLAVAARAEEVVHLDSSKPVVQWARQNAQLSEMYTLPIRWIVDDVTKFVTREVRRERVYHGIILDPPTFGRGPAGERWQIETSLPGLLEQLSELLHPQGFLLLTCHTTDLTRLELRRWVDPLFGPGRGRVDWCPLKLTTTSGRSLPSGMALRWRGKSSAGEIVDQE